MILINVIYFPFQHVAFLDILEETGVALQDDLRKKFGDNRLKYYKCNVLDEQQLFGVIQSVKDEFKYIDIVINNAGIMNDSLSHYKIEIELNVVSIRQGRYYFIKLFYNVRSTF